MEWQKLQRSERVAWDREHAPRAVLQESRDIQDAHQRNSKLRKLGVDVAYKRAVPSTRRARHTVASSAQTVLCAKHSSLGATPGVYVVVLKQSPSVSDLLDPPGTCLYASRSHSCLQF